MLGQDGNSGAHGQPKLVYLSELLQQYEGFQQEATCYVWKKEARKFHGELQKEVKQCVATRQPHQSKSPLMKLGTS